MKLVKAVTVSVSALAILSGCASTPMGPTVRALPAAGKPFETFQVEQSMCKQYANDQVQGQAERANTRGIGAGVLGTALGAGLGAAVGGGQGAAVGAASGAVVGTAVGAGSSSHEQKSIQQQYNDAYVQCMYAKGNQVEQPVQKTTIVYQPAPTVVYTAPPPPPQPTVVYVQPQPVPPPY